MIEYSRCKKCGNIQETFLYMDLKTECNECGTKFKEK